MKASLPASHLLRQYLLFVLTAVFLLTMIRAAYGLWYFPSVEESGAIVALFVQGLRFDLAYIGMVCLVPVVLGSLLSMTQSSRIIAKVLIMVFLLSGLVIILSSELITPWMLHSRGLRPDMELLKGISNPVLELQSLLAERIVPAVIGLVLCVLIIVAFWSRMEPKRFLRYPVSKPSALLLAVIGGFVCLMAIWSTADLRRSPISPVNAAISEDATVNELAMNSAYKTLYTFVGPMLDDIARRLPAGN
jgi:hypothetical protein